MTTVLSARQYPLLKLFVTKYKGDANWWMKLDEAATLDQRPFRSMLMRGWVAYEKGYGFKVTWEGREAWNNFLHTSIERTNVNAPLCAFFYSQHKVARPEPKRGLRIVKKGAA